MKKKVSTFHQLKSLSQKPVCLVVGGAGFIGSHLCEELLNQGCQVICIDNLLTGKKENLANCLRHQDFTFLKHDLTKPLKKKLPKIDYLFHLAGVEAYLSKKKISLDILKVNAVGTTNLLELARKDKAKFLLASSVDVYSAALSATSLRDYYPKSEKDLSSHHEAKRFAESLTTEYFKKYRLDARIVRLGQVYGPRMSLEVGTRVVDLIKETIAGEPLKIPGNGQTPSYSTFVLDVIDGLLRAMFIAGTNGRIFSLVDPKGITLLSFTHELQRQSSPHLAIEFVAKSEEEKPPFEKKKLLITQRYLGWAPKTELKEGIEKTLSFFSGKARQRKQRIEEKLRGQLPQFSLKNPFRLAIVASLLVLVLITYPFFTLAFNVFWGANRLHQAKKTFASAQFEQSASYSDSAQKSFSQAKKEIGQFSWLLKRSGLRWLEVQAEEDLGVGQKLAEALHHASLAAQAGGELLAIVFQNQEGGTQKLTAQIETELDSVYAPLSRIQAELENGQRELPFSGGFGLKEGKAELKEKLPQMRGLILQLKGGIEILPELIALPGKRTYLVLFQNNMELRPTGGFIGSFALATFEDGRFIDFEVHNVYTADGQLKGHVEPPIEIKKYLGEAAWYLRDSNFDPDFPTSAIKAEWFLEKEMGRVVDGVLAVNLDFAQKILEAIGEIELPDYQEKISSANLFERAQYQAEIGFFPGSTQKEDFLGTLSRALIVRARDSSQEEWFGLGTAVYRALSEKDLLVYLHDQEAAEVISQLGWDGSIKTVNCQMIVENCFADYLMFVEANFGVNKANFLVKRDLTHQVKIADDGTIKETLQIVYQNESPSENFPVGRYKNYLRVYTPKGTKLGEIKIDGEALESGKINIDQVSDKTIFGFLVEVPIKERKKVEIVYQLAEKLNLADPKATYRLLLQRQSGSSKDVFNLWLSYPSGITPLKIYPQASPGPNTILFQPKLDQDLLFGVDFGR